MKKLVLTAAFVMASFGAFASNNDVKLNNGIATVKKNVEIANNLNKTLKIYLKVPVNCDANIDTGLFTIVIVWCC